MQATLGDAYYTKAVAFANSKKLSEAKKLLLLSLSLEPKLWKSWNVFGLCAYKLGEFAQAEAAWLKSLALAPEQNPAKKYLAQIQSPAFNKIEALYKASLTVAHKGDYTLALEKLNGLPVQDFVVFSNFSGLCHLAAGNLKAARDAWSQSLRLDSTNPDALRYLQEATPREVSLFTRWLKRLKNGGSANYDIPS